MFKNQKTSYYCSYTITRFKKNNKITFAALLHIKTCHFLYSLEFLFKFWHFIPGLSYFWSSITKKNDKFPFQSPRKRTNAYNS